MQIPRFLRAIAVAFRLADGASDRTPEIETMPALVLCAWCSGVIDTSVESEGCPSCLHEWGSQQAS